MRIGEIGYKGKTAVVTGVAGITTVGTELAGGEMDGSGLLDTANWMGKAGLLWAGIRLAKIGVSRLAVGLEERNAADWAEVDAGLPTLKDGVSPTRIMSRVYNGGNQELAGSFFMTAQAWRSGKPEGSYLAHWSLQQDITHAVERISVATNTEDREAAHLKAYRMGWLLDEVAPIADECASTPQTSDSGKFWNDFIDRQYALAQPLAA